MNILGWIDRINDLYGNEPVPRRFDTTQWLRPGFRGAGLVEQGLAGVRQGYRGEDEITKLSKEYQKITGSETSLSNIKSRVRRNVITEDLIDKYKREDHMVQVLEEKRLKLLLIQNFTKQY